MTSTAQSSSNCRPLSPGATIWPISSEKLVPVRPWYDQMNSTDRPSPNA